MSKPSEEIDDEDDQLNLITGIKDKNNEDKENINNANRS